MAAGAWTFYNKFSFYLGDGTIDLDTDNFRISLYQSAADVATVTQSIISELSSEVSEANGYSSSGAALAGVTWATGASAKEFRFDSNDPVWTASAGAIANVKYAVIWRSAGTASLRKLVCYSQLSSSQFSVGTGNTLTIQMSANGIFEVNYA